MSSTHVWYEILLQKFGDQILCCNIYRPSLHNNSILKVSYLQSLLCIYSVVAFKFRYFFGEVVCFPFSIFLIPCAHSITQCIKYARIRVFTELYSPVRIRAESTILSLCWSIRSQKTRILAFFMQRKWCFPLLELTLNHTKVLKLQP